MSFQAASRVTLRYMRENEEGRAGREEREEGCGTHSPDRAVPPLSGITIRDSVSTNFQPSSFLFFFFYFLFYIEVLVSPSVVPDSLRPHRLCQPGSSILQARILEWVAIPFSRGSS